VAEEKPHPIRSGHFSPLRYPGGKGKLARFIKSIIRANGLSDGHYMEPYAGGAAVAWELLITGVVRRVSINDISRPVYAFWHSVLNDTERLCRMIKNRPVSLDEWDAQKAVFRRAEDEDLLKLGFAFFFLNRTNRSGILNGGVIGGRDQKGEWLIDARYNKSELVTRIEKIASLKSRVSLSQLDAVAFLEKNAVRAGKKSLIYIDPPYFEKGRFLYYDAYKAEDHMTVARAVAGMEGCNWVVSYDDVRPIHSLYSKFPWMQYTLNYSARNVARGREVMFFSPGLIVPEVVSPLMELDRDLRRRPMAVSRRSFST
jgi:DNA adenine methylase